MLHVFILIMVLIILKVLFITNKPIKSIFIKSSILTVFTVVVVLIALNIKFDGVKLMNIPSDNQELGLSLMSFDYEPFYELENQEATNELYDTIVSNLDYSYSLNISSQSFKTFSDAASIIIQSKGNNIFFSITDNGLLYYDKKYYYLEDDKLYDKLVAFLTPKEER